MLSQIEFLGQTCVLHAFAIVALNDRFIVLLSSWIQELLLMVCGQIRGTGRKLPWLQMEVVATFVTG